MQRHKSYHLDMDGCRYSRTVQSSYLDKFHNIVTYKHDRTSLKNGVLPNFNSGIYHTPINREGIRGKTPDYYDVDSELRFGTLYMIDFSNLIYRNTKKLNSENIVEFMEILISKHQPPASGSLISGSKISNELVNKFLDMGFCVYNEWCDCGEMTVDAQIMSHLTRIIEDPRRREKHFSPGVYLYYPHYESVVIITSDYNNDNIVSFPQYMSEIIISGITVNHYDTMHFHKRPKNKALLDGLQLYKNRNVDEIISLIKGKTYNILLPNFTDHVLMSHNMIIKNGYYYISFMGSFIELNQHLMHLNQVWFSYINVYKIAESQLNSYTTDNCPENRLAIY